MESVRCRRECGAASGLVTTPYFRRARSATQRDTPALFGVETGETEAGEKVYPLTGGLHHAAERSCHSSI